MTHFSDLIMIPIQIIVALFTLYYFMIACFGMWRRKEKKILTPQKTFAIVVAAHNEEKVIGQLVENLHVLNYPKELYDIFVIADNCKDSTADIARDSGAIVHERYNLEQRGKGYAMEWMFAKIFRLERRYDGIVIFDADNLVHPDFLMEMNNRICKGEQVIQGYLDAKNPHDTWITGTFAIAFWVSNHLWYLAKYNLGLSCALGGTGMCISSDILERFGWGATCLTEDMEFTMKILQKGIRTTWAHDAVVYDEKPLTFKQSWRQRKRWAQGHFDVASRYMFNLLIAGIKQRDIRLFDGVIQLLQPYFLLLSTIFIICNQLNVTYQFYTNVLYVMLPVQVWTFIALAQYLFPMIVLAKIRAHWKSWVYSLLYPVFIYSWIPITFIGFLYRNKREWSHTQHTRSLSYQEVLITNQFSKEDILTKQALK